MKIARDGYLDQIKKFMHNGLVKVITGIRRCGKSYFLFDIFCDYLRGQGVDSSQIIEIRLDEDEFEQLRNPRKLSEYVKARLLADGRQMYVLIDEIQECKPVDGDNVTFYDVLNTLMKKADVYVTGSNSEMLSEDIATNFRDRGTIIRMWPLSFAEYYHIGGKEKVDAWEDFLVWGGMPLAVLSPDQSSRETYLKNLFKRVYFADIVERYLLKNDVALGAVCDVMASAVGGLTNAKRISDTLSTAASLSTCPQTVARYLDIFCHSFLFEKASRYDVKGRKYLEGAAKYYCVDTGLRNARLNFRQIERTHLMENVIYCELLRRGYNVDVGVVQSIEKDAGGKSVRKAFEIDFVVNCGFKRVYIQSALNIDDHEKLENEVRPFRKSGDFFRRLVVTGENGRLWQNEEGVVFVGVIPFLLDSRIVMGE